METPNNKKAIEVISHVLADIFCNQLGEHKADAEKILASLWQPIATAPKDGSLIDLKVVWADTKGNQATRRIPDCYWCTKTKYWRTTRYNADGKPCMRGETATHWMEIPK